MSEIIKGSIIRWKDGNATFKSRVLETDINMGIKVALGDDMQRWIDGNQVIECLGQGDEIDSWANGGDFQGGA